LHPQKLQKILDVYIGIPLCVLLGGFRPRWWSAKDPPERILFIQLSAIGDTILAVPAIRAVRRRFPDAHLAMMASSINLEYLERCPYIDQRLPCRLEELIVSPRKTPAFLAALRRQRFDWVIDFEHWPRFSALIAYASGAPRRIGFRAAGQHRHYPFTDVVPHAPGRHEVVNFLQIARLLDCPIQDARLETWPGQTDWAWARRALGKSETAGRQPMVAFHPEAGRRNEPRRRWPHERYVELAEALARRYNAQIVLTGAHSEVELCQRIASQMKSPGIVVAGQTTVNQLAAVFGLVEVVVCGNCGPMHLAAAAGTPVVALHGPTNPAQWGPWGENHTVIAADVPCSPCLNLGFEYGCKALSDGLSPCMYTIPVREVVEACDKHLLGL
jgi:lipopolysaccharide heptosyltransferase II